MARIYGEIASSALMTFDKSFSRSNGQPLDSTEIFYSLAAAQEYAATDVAYVGQKIVVVATVDNVTTVTHYGIEPDNSLKELGALPVGDDLTVEVVDGKIQFAALEGHTEGTYQPFLVDGKIEWRKPSATTVEGLDSRLTTAEDEIGDLKDIINNKESGLVKSVEDNATAIANEVTAREEAVQDISDDILAINNKIGEVTDGKTVVEMIVDSQYDDTGIKSDIEANTSEIDDIKANYLKIADKYDDTALSGRVKAIEDDYLTASDKEDLQNQINTIMNNPDTEGVINSINEFTQYISDHGEIADGFRSDIDDNADAIATEKSRAEGAESELSGRIDALEDIDHEAYIAADTALKNELNEEIAKKADASVVSDMETAYKDADDAIIARIAALEGVESEKNVIASVDEDQFDIDENRKLILLDIAMGKVTGLSDALAGKVDVEEGKRLMTDAEGEKLDGIAAGAQVNIIDLVDTAQFAIDESKKLTLLDIAMSKVTGLQDALDAKANKGTTLAAYGITDAYTKTETEARIQDVLDGLSDTSETAASVAQALETYKTSNDGRVDTIEGKLADIEEGAQVNKIETIKVGNTVLSIVDKTVEIAVGAGLKASGEVTIAEDGTLGVGEINVNKLVQSDDEVLILNGGASK